MMRNLVTLGLSEVEKSVVKATYDDELPPKEKHVVFLTECTAQYDLVTFFDRRLSMPKWNVVFKTLVVLHRLSIEGHDRFMRDLASSHHTFNLHSFFDGSIGAQDHSDFITRYAEYLAQKVYVFRILGVSAERRAPNESKEWARKLAGVELVKALPALSQQLDRLLACAPYGSEAFTASIPVAAFSLLVKDAFRIYSTLTVLLLGVVDHYLELDAAQTKLVLQVCQSFRSQNSRFRAWTKSLTKLGFAHDKLVPELVPIPDALFELLQDHIAAKGGVVKPASPQQLGAGGAAGAAGAGAPVAGRKAAQSVAAGASPAAAAPARRTTVATGAAPAAAAAAPRKKPAPATASAGSARPPARAAQQQQSDSEPDPMDSSDEDEEEEPVRRVTKKTAQMSIAAAPAPAAVGRKQASSASAASAYAAAAAAPVRAKAAPAPVPAPEEEEDEGAEDEEEDEEEETEEERRARKEAKRRRKEEKRAKKEAKRKKKQREQQQEEEESEEEAAEGEPAPAVEEAVEEEEEVAPAKPKKEKKAKKSKKRREEEEEQLSEEGEGAGEGEVDLISLMTAASKKKATASPVDDLLFSSHSHPHAASSAHVAASHSAASPAAAFMPAPATNVFNPYGTPSAHSALSTLAPLSATANGGSKRNSLSTGGGPGEDNTTAIGGVYDPAAASPGAQPSKSKGGAAADPFFDLGPDLGAAATKPSKSKRK